MSDSLSNTSLGANSTEYSNQISNDSSKSLNSSLSTRSVESSQKYRMRVKIKEIEREHLLQELEEKNSQLKDRAELIESVINEMVDFLLTKDNN
jgi:hypothetical protein